jgi:hypothetical protein
MTVKLILTVLNLFYAGSGSYAQHFHDNGKRFKIAPLLIAAVAMDESNFRRTIISRTNDYGIMQLHVSKHTHRHYIGREKLLFDPKLNIYLGTKMLVYWRWYHEKHCAGKKHHWLHHYNQGARVSTRGWKGGYARRVLKIYRKLNAIKLKLLRKQNVTS